MRRTKEVRTKSGECVRRRPWPFRLRMEEIDPLPWHTDPRCPNAWIGSGDGPRHDEAGPPP